MDSDFLRQSKTIESHQIPVVAYYRVSTGQQSESQLGLEAQASAVERLCASRSYGIVAAYAGRGVSGSKPLSERTALMAAIADVKQSKAKALVVSRLDRLSREPLVFITVERLLAKIGARLISAAGEGTESDSPGAVLMRRILQAVAEQESALISLRTTAALKAKKDRGEWIGRPPFGFRINTETKSFEITDMYYAIHKILRMKARGKKQKQIIEKMIELYPNESWSQSKISKLVTKWKTVYRLQSYRNKVVKA
jgi:DNA invertase Pin-like site-specific DNA recombinase